MATEVLIFLDTSQMLSEREARTRRRSPIVAAQPATAHTASARHCLALYVRPPQLTEASSAPSALRLEGDACGALRVAKGGALRSAVDCRGVPTKVHVMPSKRRSGEGRAARAASSTPSGPFAKAPSPSRTFMHVHNFANANGRDGNKYAPRSLDDPFDAPTAAMVRRFPSTLRGGDNASRSQQQRHSYMGYGSGSDASDAYSDEYTDAHSSNVGGHTCGRALPSCTSVAIPKTVGAIHRHHCRSRADAGHDGATKPYSHASSYSDGYGAVTSSDADSDGDGDGGMLDAEAVGGHAKGAVQTMTDRCCDVGFPSVLHFAASPSGRRDEEEGENSPLIDSAIQSVIGVEGGGGGGGCEHDQHFDDSISEDEGDGIARGESCCQHFASSVASADDAVVRSVVSAIGGAVERRWAAHSAHSSDFTTSRRSLSLGEGQRSPPPPPSEVLTVASGAAGTGKTTRLFGAVRTREVSSFSPISTNGAAEGIVGAVLEALCAEGVLSNEEEELHSRVAVHVSVVESYAVEAAPCRSSFDSRPPPLLAAGGEVTDLGALAAASSGQKHHGNTTVAGHSTGETGKNTLLLPFLGGACGANAEGPGPHTVVCRTMSAVRAVLYECLSRSRGWEGRGQWDDSNNAKALGTRSSSNISGDGSDVIEVLPRNARDGHGLASMRGFEQRMAALLGKGPSTNAINGGFGGSDTRGPAANSLPGHFGEERVPLPHSASFSSSSQSAPIAPSSARADKGHMIVTLAFFFNASPLLANGRVSDGRVGKYADAKTATPFSVWRLFDLAGPSVGRYRHTLGSLYRSRSYAALGTLLRMGRGAAASGAEGGEAATREDDEGGDKVTTKERGHHSTMVGRDSPSDYSPPFVREATMSPRGGGVLTIPHPSADVPSRPSLQNSRSVAFECRRGGRVKPTAPRCSVVEAIGRLLCLTAASGTDGAFCPSDAAEGAVWGGH